MCLLYDGNSRRLNRKWFYGEKPRIEPATPGLQGIALIHYTIGASQYGHIHGCQKSLAIQMPKLRKRAINILSFFFFFLKGGLYLAALKSGGGGVFGRTSVLCHT